jgi:hypothetical protein
MRNKLIIMDLFKMKEMLKPRFPAGPYPISYRSIIPEITECSNLLVPVCLSATHIAHGTIRMEPVFMILGQSAATAACIAIDKRVKIQEVAYQELKTQLLNDRQILYVIQ